MRRIAFLPSAETHSDPCRLSYRQATQRRVRRPGTVEEVQLTKPENFWMAPQEAAQKGRARTAVADDEQDPGGHGDSLRQPSGHGLASTDARGTWEARGPSKGRSSERSVTIDATQTRRHVPIDIIFLVERLEALLANGRRMPMTNSVIVDQVAALDLIDQLRVAVPEEVRQAKRVNEETSRLVERAQEEAERILARAQEQAAFLIEERELTRAAEVRSREIIAAGDVEADEIRRGADQYAAEVLIRLERECIKALQSIKQGLALLDERYPSDSSNGSHDGAAGGATAEQKSHAQL